MVAASAEKEENPLNHYTTLRHLRLESRPLFPSVGREDLFAFRRRRPRRRRRRRRRRRTTGGGNFACFAFLLSLSSSFPAEGRWWKRRKQEIIKCGRGGEGGGEERERERRIGPSRPRKKGEIIQDRYGENNCCKISIVVFSCPVLPFTRSKSISIYIQGES